MDDEERQDEGRLDEDQPDLILQVIDADDEELEAGDDDIVEDDTTDDDDDSDGGHDARDTNDDEGDANADSDAIAPEDQESFDMEIPLQHRYLGESQPVAGRTILDENLIQDLPIISKSGIILMPGQIIPITFFHPSVISLMKRLIETTKTFGVIQHRSEISQIGLHWECVSVREGLTRIGPLVKHV